MQFWPVSLQNRLKMCGFFRTITWTTGRERNRLQSVSNGPVASFEEQATATEKSVLIGPKRSSSVQLIGCMDRTCRHYCQLCLLFHFSLYIQSPYLSFHYPYPYYYSFFFLFFPSFPPDFLFLNFLMHWTHSFVFHIICILVGWGCYQVHLSGIFSQ
jgi:hypothetical protein